jgi:hypothetical protein
VIRNARDGLVRDLAENDPKDMEEYAERLARQHGLPRHLVRQLAYGMIEAAITGWAVAERRTLGTEPLVFSTEAAPDPVPQPTPPATDRSGPSKPSRPIASSLVDAFGEWGRKSSNWRAGAESQAKVSVSMFLEVCGDRPIGDYTRADGDEFRTTLRSLPAVYRSPRGTRTSRFARLSRKQMRRRLRAWARKLSNGTSGPCRGFSRF